MHIPVLLKEATAVLNPKPGEFFIDGTVNGGGHAVAILEKISPAGKFLGIDWDENAIERLKIEGLKNCKNAILVQGNYADLPEILEKIRKADPSIPLRANGLLLDLGMSSEQLEHSGRGFSFRKNEPLIMQYQSSSEILTAAEIINSFKEEELADIFFKYGEERFSRKIAKEIIKERQNKRILTTFELVEIIKKAAPKNYEKGRIHPATRIFQALRIYVNSELENLEKLLKNLDKIFPSEANQPLAEKPKGRVAIISFHSLEDRLVKNYFREMAKQGKAEILTKKPIRPTFQETQANPRARSAKMRAVKLRFNSELRM
ncbi:16S rRNA (cytosine(1402)-N(4))-methyltransferase [Candidatus Jorgensenbacteria bacterium RIFCSPLOWO2_12_FULL_42_11]|uniref:Ribosomal RNA small subunit methyltransferase H n=2 Tax=Parcubacteria group TaxID=1794811 RepID=A0A1F6C1H9_9BACT|nr:MAG: 16S rRNA (cytosine(1402)-N(4))-methyltransferase [Candidatus Jorgensenbacteria bacterium RIFCSPLOWO2_12_FULL_42_11]OHB04847.1 MAG: 16S rRNA (cytosine(1402)-N(4))-methyltransferase [Candidatus Zambryskibacteria bacterium RIFCSPLOWO2_01_FULL_45_43]